MRKKTSLPYVSCLVYTILWSIALTAADTPLPGQYTKTDDGLLVHVKRKMPNGVCLVKLQAITDHIIRVTASPVDSLYHTNSLITLPKKRPAVNFTLKEEKEQVTLLTPALKATVSLITGEVSFADQAGKLLLGEPVQGGKTFQPTTEEGGPTYIISQAFMAAPGEALYGLGQHQNGIMNYRGTQVELQQYNTDVAVPFLLSNKQYGILWDNYSITKVGDTRDYLPLSALKLYAQDGKAGWLTATYINKKTQQPILQRPESAIGYDYLCNQKDFPAEVKLQDVAVNWEGDIESAYTGTHQLLFRYGGYGKIWIEGKLLADRWRQSWNAGTAMLPVYLEKGKKYHFRIEWLPDGGESYVSCKWLSPLQGDQQQQYAFSSASGGQLDYYFVHGNTADEVIAGYRELTGAATLLPKWAMGLWQSRERYKTQEEILQTVQEFRKRKIPLDNIVLDWSYWKENDWGSQEFDSSRFADPAGMINTLHEQYNTRFMISVWPKFYEGIAAYKEFDQQGWLYKRNIAEGRRDWIAKGYHNTFYDAFNPQARTAFWNLMDKKLFRLGVDAWWLDASEPDVHSNLSPQERRSIMNPTALGAAARYENAYPLQHVRGVYEGQRNVSPGQRVFILTRSAFAGSQRYAAATWSGDISARWHDLKIQIPAGLNFSLSGIPYWTVDIGGFAVEKRFENAKGEDLEEWRELTTRWYQFGAFCPLFRVHGQYPYREIYNIAPEDHPAYKSMLYYDKLRYRLMPYIYSLAGKTWQQHSTIMRALVMDFPNDEKVNNIGDQYLFGPALLVSPVTDYKATGRQLYLPAGTGWYDFYTGAWQQGGQTIQAEAPYERIPLYVKEGAIIPVGPEIQYSTEKPQAPLTIYVYTGHDGTFTLYEDENTNNNYEKGYYTNIDFRYEEATGTLTIEDRKGSFTGMPQNRTFNIIWIDKNKPKAFDANAKADKAINYKGKKQMIKRK